MKRSPLVVLGAITTFCEYGSFFASSSTSWKSSFQNQPKEMVSEGVYPKSPSITKKVYAIESTSMSASEEAMINSLQGIVAKDTSAACIARIDNLNLFKYGLSYCFGATSTAKTKYLDYWGQSQRHRPLSLLFAISQDAKKKKVRLPLLQKER